MAQDKNTPATQAAGQSASDSQSTSTSRRRFLTGSAAAVGAGAAAAVGFPSIAVAQTTTLRFQSTWPNQDIFHEFARDYVRIANEMSGGRLEINLLQSGAVVGALELQDAVISGALDGGHGVCAYWYGKHKAYSLFGTPPPFGWDAHQFLAWFWTGGGKELYQELLDMLELPLVGYLTGPMPTQALGWFKEPIRSVDDLSGLKYRTVGLAADLMDEVGAAVTIMGGPDIVPAMDRGLLDGAEFNNASSDRLLGFPDVSKTWMLRSYHQDCESFEIMFNKEKHDSLPEEFQAILQYAAKAASSEMYWKAMERYPRDLQAMREEQGVKTYITPDSVLEAQLEAWNTVIERQSEEDAFFKKVVDHQREYCERVVGWHLEGNTPKEPAYRHFFGKAPTDSSEML
ncbi:TRAP transporter substrate-binding protein [Billgrantia lactosivorans]|uniref:TRAP transporter substrate-binding protein n=1 Tax=Billgrantia lactosivorans TaxID=2185141 RepID=UPI000DABB4C2|nr:TRAP transporter substrate-binding protein [Halomonas lactosivorans]